MELGSRYEKFATQRTTGAQFAALDQPVNAEVINSEKIGGFFYGIGEPLLVVATAFLGGFVKASQCVCVEQHLQKRVHVTAFELKLLRHRHTNDFAAIAVGANLRIVLTQHYYSDNNEFVELSVLR